jgi:hypothetical protein
VLKSEILNVLEGCRIQAEDALFDYADTVEDPETDTHYHELQNRVRALRLAINLVEKHPENEFAI